MISLHYNNCPFPILKAPPKSLSSIMPKKGKDAWDIRDDDTGNVLVSYNPLARAKHLPVH